MTGDGMNSVEALEQQAQDLNTEQMRRKLWLFHLFGEGNDGGGPLQPAILEALAGNQAEWPLLAGSDGEQLAHRSFGQWLEEALARLESEGTDCRVLQANVAYSAEIMGDLCEETLTPLPDLMQQWAKVLPRALDLSEAGAKVLQGELDALLDRLPQAIEVYAADRKAPLHLYLRILEHQCGKRRQVLCDKVVRLANGLDQLLLLARSREDDNPERVAEALGSAGSRFINPGRMAANLAKTHGAEPISPQRRQRIQDTCGRLHDFLEHPQSYPQYYLLHNENEALDVVAENGVVSGFADCLEAAAATYELFMKDLTDVLLACRVATLELAGDYEPELHDPVFARLDQDCLTSDEIAFLPVIAVVEQVETVRAEMRGSYHDLLGSGLPVQILLFEDRPERERIRQDLAWQAINYREVLVNATSATRPHHMIESFMAALNGDTGSVTVVACPGRIGSSGAEAFLRARITPLYRYLPQSEAGPSRFLLGGNQQVEEIWPRYTIHLEQDGQNHEVALPFTFADAVAICPSLRSHFYLIPRGQWNDEDQIALSDYRSDTTKPLVPYIWVIDPHQHLQRAALSRALVLACENRMRLWRCIQELGGIHNPYAEKAAGEAREAIRREAEAALKAIEEHHRAELARVRETSGMEAMERLARVLLDAEGGAITLSAKPVPAPAASDGASSQQPEPVAVEEAPEPEETVAEPEDEPFSEEAYIDSELCTACNECINLNPVMFKYNGDKQATIADLAAGTFLQLVTAAEKCPARIIHPGAPRSDDTTVTPELQARAARFA